jgi:hypothetical protein
MSPYNDVKYGADPVTCTVTEKTNYDCKIMMIATNNSNTVVTPDYTGTDGPGFAERGTHEVFIIDTSGNKYYGYPNRDSYAMEIQAGETVRATVDYNENGGNVIPKQLVIFGQTINLEVHEIQNTKK